jgi:hypothetical protein
MNQVNLSLFFGNKRIAVFHSISSFHMYLIEKGIPHSMKNGEIGLWDADGYWYC